jgi:16S rRNA (guanine527-N7)-methyltransferase
VKLGAAIDHVVDALRPAARVHRAALQAFVALVQTWNAKIDLTAARTHEALADVMLADALVMADDAFVASGAHLLDVGSGAGGPAIPLAIVRPDVRVTMVEPLGKRVAFLRTAVGTLGLASRVSVVQARADAIGDVHADVASARATFPPNEWLAIGATLAPSVLVLTTEGEMPSGTPTQRRDYLWPHASAPRVLLRFDRGR